MRWTLPCTIPARWALGKDLLDPEGGFPEQQDPTFTRDPIRRPQDEHHHILTLEP